MTLLWKGKHHEYLLVLTVMTLVKPGSMNDGETGRKISGLSVINMNELKDEPAMELVVGTSVNADTLQYQLTHWNESESSLQEDNMIYYVEGLPEFLFHSSAENSSMIWTDLLRCLQDFHFVTCLKFLLVNRLDDLLDYMRKYNLTSISVGNSLVRFKTAPGVNHFERRGVTDGVTFEVDEDIKLKVMELFKDRALQINLLPGLGVDIAPVPEENSDDFIGFKAKPYIKWTLWKKDEELDFGEGRKKKRKGGFKMPSMMILPQLIMLGFMPFALANLQAMVMNAFMLNMMALNSAIFMTIRNLVFGPRGGPRIKYVNYGYRKKKKSNVPTIIVHSPAAFVRQPFHKFRPYKRPNRHEPPNPHLHETVFKSEDYPTSYTEVQQRPGYNYQEEYAGESYEEHSAAEQDPSFIHREDGVQVLREKGELDGKNKVRIRINTDRAPSMKEILHRIKTIEQNSFAPYDTWQSPNENISFNYGSASGNHIPWNHFASHNASNSHPSKVNIQNEYGDGNESEFRPLIKQQKEIFRYR